MKILREAVRSTSMGIQAIDNVLPYVEDCALVKTIKEQKEILKSYGEKAREELTETEIAAAEGTKFSKTMLKAGASISAMMNNDTAHIAQMLIEGYETGIVSMQKCVNEMEKSNGEVPAIAKELIKTYDKHIKTLRSYL